MKAGLRIFVKVYFATKTSKLLLVRFPFSPCQFVVLITGCVGQPMVVEANGDGVTQESGETGL